MDNISLFFLIFSLSNHSALVDTLMIFGARFIIYLTFLLMFILSFKGGIREKKAFVLTVLSIPIVLLIIKGIHIFFYEPRPFVSYHLSPLVTPVGDASFPSVHVSLMTTFAFSCLFFKSKWASLFLVLVIWVGLSRIYVGVHYPFDILGGMIVGLFSLVIAKKIITLLKTKLF